MGEDEKATVRTMTSHRELLSTPIQKYYGWVVISPDDNVLAEFVSVVAALRSATAIKEKLQPRPISNT
jgi:hypothetical protein